MEGGERDRPAGAGRDVRIRRGIPLLYGQSVGLEVAGGLLCELLRVAVACELEYVVVSRSALRPSAGRAASGNSKQRYVCEFFFGPIALNVATAELLCRLCGFGGYGRRIFFTSK